MNQKIKILYFSATGTTEKIVSGIADKLSENMAVKVSDIIDFTLPSNRSEPLLFSESDVVIIGVPVYAGRVPNVLLNYLKAIKGNGAFAIAVVVYGNRNYDDALVELKDILESGKFKVIAGGAFIGEHSFSETLAKNRPDEKDMTIASDFADEIYEKVFNQKIFKPIIVKGNSPYRNYYRPINKDGIPVDIRRVKPKTNGNCTGCKLCVKVCPMGSIDSDDTSRLNGICIKCGACIKKCPVQAKYYDDEDYLRHKKELEIEFKERKEPELFI